MCLPLGAKEALRRSPHKGVPIISHIDLCRSFGRTFDHLHVRQSGVSDTQHEYMYAVHTFIHQMLAIDDDVTFDLDRNGLHVHFNVRLVSMPTVVHELAQHSHQASLLEKIRWCT